MAYTLLRATSQGVLLLEQHRRRLALAPESARAFEDFARVCEPGVYAIRADEKVHSIERREGSRLFDGMPARLAISPVLASPPRLAKPAPPGPYQPVRAQGIATLLTDPTGQEIFESCSAAVLGWDGTSLICPPDDRPRVWSTAMAAVREAFPVRQSPLPATGMALLLINAVKGTCVLARPGEPEFPEKTRAEIEATLESTARRP